MLLSPDGNGIRESISSIHLSARQPGSVLNTHRSVHALWNSRFDLAGDHQIIVRARMAESDPWVETARLRLPVVEAAYPFFPATNKDAQPGGR